MTRITKDPEERKNEILDAAEELFNTKGFEETAVSDIVKKVGVAQGLFYYYFKSKKEVLEAVLERKVSLVLSSIHELVYDKSTNAVEKLTTIIRSLFHYNEINKNLTEFVHQEKNELLHAKMAVYFLKQLAPLFIEIINQGIAEKAFNTEYPQETAEILLYGFGEIHNCQGTVSEQEFAEKMKAMTNILERLLGVQNGSMKIWSEAHEA